MHFFLRELMGSYPGKLRLVHRHFPMDHRVNPIVKEPFHVGSGDMALLSLYAAEKNNFWIINDMLFTIDTTKGHFNIREMAKHAGFDVPDFARALNDMRLKRKLRADILEGIELGIRATPAYIINGKVLIGYVPAEIIKPIIQ